MILAMDNAVFAIQASERSLDLFFTSLVQYELFWGFLIGFVVASIIYGFIITENPKQMAAMLLYDKGESFEKLYHRNPDGSYEVSYSTHSSKVDKFKLKFVILSVVIAILIITALLRN